MKDSAVYKLIRKRYTFRSRILGARTYTVRLHVGCQGFTVASNVTKAAAEWYRDQLATALTLLVSEVLERKK